MRKMSISSMCTRLGILACLFAVLPSGTTAEGQIISKIRCLNNPFYGEALLITTVDQPLRFQCDIDIHPSVPENYAQTRIDFNWSVTSGTIQKTENTCVWTNPSPGLQTIQVKGKVTYESTQTGGLFSSKPEDIVFPFQSHLKCLMPIQADMDKSAKINGFEIGKYPNPLDPFDLRAASNPDRIKNNYTTYLPPTLFYEVTPETYQAFELVAIRGLSGEHVAKITGLSRNAIYLSRKRVFERLRALGAPYRNNGQHHQR